VYGQIGENGAYEEEKAKGKKPISGILIPNNQVNALATPGHKVNPYAKTWQLAATAVRYSPKKWTVSKRSACLRRWGSRSRIFN
jgi:hypothetical protein